MKPNPFSNNPDTRTDVDTAKNKQLADDDDVKPVLLMAYSSVDNDETSICAKDRWELVGNTTVGRKAPADIAVSDSCMSKEHFRILSSNSAFYIEDLGSTNGTFLKARHRSRQSRPSFNTASRAIRSLPASRTAARVPRNPPASYLHNWKWI
jgi:hypothetical protein